MVHFCARQNATKCARHQYQQLNNALSITFRNHKSRNPEVGYCQGFNMLGALILQVMERSEIESLKVMIYLIEGVLPNGYFSGSLGGLQADMAVFRDILSTRMPKLSKHLQKLQGTIGDSKL